MPCCNLEDKKCTNNLLDLAKKIIQTKWQIFKVFAGYYIGNISYIIKVVKERDIILTMIRTTMKEAQEEGKDEGGEEEINLKDPGCSQT